MALPVGNGGGVEPLTDDEMVKALSYLNDEIGTNELLMSVAPLRLISVGGALAVRVCRNRDSTWDIDCLLDPNVAAADDYIDEFHLAVARVARAHGYGRDWLNHEVELFVGRERRMTLFLESVEQNIPIFSGANIVIYAGRLDWALERKVRRLAHSTERKIRKPVDLPDAAALIRLMRDNGAPELSWEYVRALNFNGFDIPPTDEAIQQVADYYLRTYGEVGIRCPEWVAQRRARGESGGSSSSGGGGGESQQQQQQQQQQTKQQQQLNDDAEGRRDEPHAEHHHDHA
jgi:hypothetical protein